VQARAAFTQAAELVQDRPASRDQALALASYAAMLFIPHRPAEAEPVLRRAVAVAAAVGDPDALATAKGSHGTALLALGRVDQAIAAAREALVLGLKHSPPPEVVRTYLNFCYFLWLASRLDEAIDVGREGVAYSTTVGLLHGYGQGVVGNLIAALVAAGRWD
jgi:tetratricopeptide (TPR) repeat protein